MNKYVIERSIPGAGGLSTQDFAAIVNKSNGVVHELGPDVQWVVSYVTGDKIYCVYNAKNADLVREHAKRGGFPADNISEVRRMIDPTFMQGR